MTVSLFSGIKSFKAVETPTDVDRKLNVFLLSLQRVDNFSTNVLLNLVRAISEAEIKVQGMEPSV